MDKRSEQAKRMPLAKYQWCATRNPIRWGRKATTPTRKRANNRTKCDVPLRKRLHKLRNVFAFYLVRSDAGFYIAVTIAFAAIPIIYRDAIHGSTQDATEYQHWNTNIGSVLPPFYKCT